MSTLSWGVKVPDCKIVLLEYFQLAGVHMEVLVDDGVNLPKRLTGRKGWGICSTHFRPYLPTKRALEKLEISRAESESFGNAYMRVMSQENGLEYTSPVHRALADAIIENVSAYRFYFWLV